MLWQEQPWLSCPLLLCCHRGSADVPLLLCYIITEGLWNPCKQSISWRFFPFSLWFVKHERRGTCRPGFNAFWALASMTLWHNDSSKKSDRGVHNAIEQRHYVIDMSDNKSQPIKKTLPVNDSYGSRQKLFRGQVPIDIRHNWRTHPPS